MAKQNFIAGGYYGKLGETVGQRWKNKRTLRVYVIPHDPKTPAQVRNRTKFGQAVPYAQLGMQFNAKAPAWDNEKITEWQGRMSVAKIGVDNGVTGLSLIPIFPSGYTPYSQATRIEAIPGSGSEYTLKLSVSEAPVTGRTFSVYAECTNTETGQKEGVLVEGIAGRTITNGIDIELPGHTLAVGDMVLAVSNDDRSNEDKMFYVPPMQLSPAEIIVIDDWTVEQITNTTNFRISSEKMKGIGEQSTMSYTLKWTDTVTGEVVTETQSLTFNPGEGYAEIQNNSRPMAFAAGSEFGRNGAFVTIGGTQYRFPNVAVETEYKLQLQLTDIVPSPAVSYVMECYDADEYSVVTCEWSLSKGGDTPSNLLAAQLVSSNVQFGWSAGGTAENHNEPIIELTVTEDATKYIWRWTTDGFEGIPDLDHVVSQIGGYLRFSTPCADVAFAIPAGISFTVVHE